MDKFLVKGNVLTPVIPVLRILRQEERKLKSSRDIYRMRPYLMGCGRGENLLIISFQLFPP